MVHPYTVALVDAGGLSPALRIRAETRFAATLEHALGGTEQVAAALRAWTAANESDPAALNKNTVHMAMRWPRATSLANEAASQELGTPRDACFQVTLTRN